MEGRAPMAEPKQERALKTRAEIVRGAALAFEELGYKGASMREIVKRAGVTLGAVYFHFENKEALARAVILAQPDAMIPQLNSEGLQRLVDLSLVWARQLNTNVVLRAGVRLAVEQRAYGIDDATSFRDWQSTFAEWLEEGRERGELSPGVEPTVVAEFVVGAMTGTQHFAQLVGDVGSLPERVVRMWRLLLPGIAPKEVVDRIEVDPARAEV